MLQRLLDTVSLTGAQWLLVIVLSLLTPTFVGVDKALQRRRASSPKLPVAGAGAGAAL
jgi:Ca2+-transporting ATPase